MDLRTFEERKSSGLGDDLGVKTEQREELGKLPDSLMLSAEKGMIWREGETVSSCWDLSHCSGYLTARRKLKQWVPGVVV